MLSECVGSLAVTTVLLMIRVRICIVNAFQQASAVAVYTVVTVLQYVDTVCTVHDARNVASHFTLELLSS